MIIYPHADKSIFFAQGNAMNENLKSAIEEGRVMLLLGAGCSLSSKNNSKKNVISSYDLAKKIASDARFEYAGEPLPKVYSAVKNVLGDRLLDILETEFRNCTPSKEYSRLASYTFARIYTLNIDDALENALRRNSSQNLYIRGIKDKIKMRDQLYKNLDYIKLNGDVNNLKSGLIFSPQEYGRGDSFWYEELASDFHNYIFVFIGTQLDEPLFYHHIERFKSKNSSENQRSYCITPSASAIEKATLMSSNIEHINGTLEEFTDWLDKEFEKPNTPNSTLIKSRPEYNFSGDENQKEYIELFNDVTPVSRSLLHLRYPKENALVREFYKGYKPTWRDILDSVPAKLKITEYVFEDINKNVKDLNFRIYCIFGSAGSGKSTLLKQTALSLSDEGYPVYYVNSLNIDLKKIVKELNEKIESRFFIMIENIADMAIQLSEITESSNNNKAIFICTESSNFWNHRGAEYFKKEHIISTDISHIDEADASRILEKLKKYATWTAIEQIRPKDRVKTLINKSRKQLLIGLMELTSGLGYKDIIQREYESINSKDQKLLLILSGLATFQRVSAHESTLTRALSELDCEANIYELCNKMRGILSYRNGNIETRHFTYVNTIFENFIENETLHEIICAYINSFCVYDYPLMRNISKSEGIIYKSLVNYKFLKKFFHNNDEYILSIYKKFEKKLENEGLYLLQFGLALRGFDKQEEAFEKINFAKEAYSDSPQIDHALATQFIILALRSKTERAALSYFESAESILNRLEGAEIRINDGYPIVTLSEGHIEILCKFNNVALAREKAGEYYNRIDKKFKGAPINKRLEDTKASLFKFYTTGTFNFKSTSIK